MRPATVLQNTRLSQTADREIWTSIVGLWEADLRGSGVVQVHDGATGIRSRLKKKPEQTLVCKEESDQDLKGCQIRGGRA